MSDCFGAHLVARFHQYLDDVNFLEVTDIRELDFDQSSHDLRYTVTGFGFSGSIPYRLIASCTLEAGSCSSSARFFSAATVT